MVCAAATAIAAFVDPPTSAADADADAGADAGADALLLVGPKSKSWKGALHLLALLTHASPACSALGVRIYWSVLRAAMESDPASKDGKAARASLLAAGDPLPALAALLSHPDPDGDGVARRTALRCLSYLLTDPKGTTLTQAASEGWSDAALVPASGALALVAQDALPMITDADEVTCAVGIEQRCKAMSMLQRVALTPEAQVLLLTHARTTSTTTTSEVAAAEGEEEAAETASEVSACDGLIAVVQRGADEVGSVEESDALSDMDVSWLQSAVCALGWALAAGAPDTAYSSASGSSQSLSGDPRLAGLYEVEAVTAEEAPIEEVPIEEAPIEEAPTEEAPTEEAPTEEAPAETPPAVESPPMHTRMRQAAEALSSLLASSQMALAASQPLPTPIEEGAEGEEEGTSVATSAMQSLCVAAVESLGRLVDAHKHAREGT